MRSNDTTEVGSGVSVSLRHGKGNGHGGPADQHAELMEALSRLEDERRHTNAVLAAVAHDMKAPVAIITGYLKLLESQKIGSLNERQSEILEDMHVNCVRMKHLISEFLTYGAVNADNNVVNFETSDLNACLEEVCREWMGLCKVKAVSLEFSPCPEIPPLPFDYHKIKQAVACLIDNALKFTPSGKSVKLMVERHFWERRLVLGAPMVERRKSESIAPNSVLISVTDAGPGIAPEYQQEVFEEFYTRRCGEVQSSTGLGLAIARRVSQAHGGKIWVESTVGSGSKFCIVIPLRPPIVSAAGRSRGPRAKAV